MIVSAVSFTSRAVVWALIFSGSALFAADSVSAWNRILELDAGPKVQARSQDDAKQVAMSHLERQEQALRAFLKNHPAAPQTFEATLRLSRVMQIRADFERSSPHRAEAKRLIEQASKLATPEQRKEVDFARVTYVMRLQRSAGELNPEQLLGAVRGFQAAHPEDPRTARLMVEVAGLFDSSPRKKREILADALVLARDEELKARVSDDLKRLDLLHQPLTLAFESIQGSAFDLADEKGRAVVIAFFADWSPPSIASIAGIKAAVSRIPSDQVRVIGISLDPAPDDAREVLRKHGVDWITACDGKGWRGSLVRGFGINTLPTVWLVDPQGRLRSLDALKDLTSQIRQVVGR